MGKPAAFVFPGQGSQYVGMGRQALQSFAIARDALAEADQVLGFKISQMILEGPEEALTDTLNAQPALLATSIAYLRIYQQSAEALTPRLLAGHSMGEYTALVAAGALSYADGLRLVRERGRLMKEAGERHPGKMAAIIRVETDALEAICRQASGASELDVVRIANYNAPGQIVISGSAEAVDRAMALAQARGARRVIPLAVSIASHSPLMRDATAGLRQAVHQAAMRPAQVPVVSNITARPMSDPAEIADELAAQLTSPVRWIDSIQYIAAQGINTFVEIGPKDVLKGLIGRILPEVEVIGVESALGLA